MKHVEGLVCGECGRTYPGGAAMWCGEWARSWTARLRVLLRPLEVASDIEAIASSLSRESVSAGPRSLWRYAELLPTPAEGVIDIGAEATLMRPAPRLAAELGLKTL